MKTSHAPARAFTLVELLAMIFIASVMVMVVLPGLARRRCTCQRINCVNNLKQVGLSFRTWALDNQDRYPMAVAGGPPGSGATVANDQGGASFVVNGTSGSAAPSPQYLWYIFAVMSNELSTPKVLLCPAEMDS